MCFLIVCLWLLQIAITGKSFCKASAIATELIINNILRIGRVNVIGDVILFLGKLCVSLSSALFAFLMLDTHRYRSAHNKISSPVFPVVVCFYFFFSNDCFLIRSSITLCFHPSSWETKGLGKEASFWNHIKILMCRFFVNITRVSSSSVMCTCIYDLQFSYTVSYII